MMSTFQKFDPGCPIEAPESYVSPVVDSPDLTPQRRMWASRRSAMEQSGMRYTVNGVHPIKKATPFERALGLFEFGLKKTGLYEWGHKRATQIRRNSFELFFPHLPPAFDGFRILHLSDLHIDKFAGLDDLIVNAVADVQPDICFLTGDFRAADDGAYGHVLPLLDRVVKSANPASGSYAVLGNHDDHAMGLAMEAQLDIRLLANETVRIHRGSEAIRLSGADDVNRFYTKDAVDVLSGCSSEFGIALVHSPELAMEASQGGHALYLCGHTHGGQVCLPSGRPIVTHLKKNKHLASGFWRVGSMDGFTNAGCGVSGPPVRFFSHSEIAVITLRSSRASNCPVRRTPDSSLKATK